MPSTRVLEGLRLSELARCTKMCALRGLGAEPTEPTDKAKRWLARGQMFGFYAYQQFAERYGADNIEREREIPWPLGTGHADVYVKPENLIVEVVSSTSPAGVIDGKIRQARQYLHYDEEAESAAVFIINPADLDREDLIPIILRPEDAAEIESDVAAVQAAVEGGPLPECVASSPTECKHSCFCSFTAEAWAGWEPPQPLSSTDPELAGLAREYYEAKREERTAAANADLLKSARQEIEQRLADLGVEPGHDIEVAGLRLRRTRVKGSQTFSFSRAKKAGIWTPAHDDLFGPFCKVGSGFDRWMVDRVGDTPDLDFGSEAPF